MTFPFPVFCPVVSGGEPFTGIAFRSFAESAGASVTGPSDIEAGDLLLLLQLSNGSPAAARPSGFADVVNGSTSDVRWMLSWKIADGSEASASLAGMTGGGSVHRKLLVVLDGNVGAATPSGAWGEQFEVSAGPSNQTVLASGGSAPLLVVGAYMSDGTIDPRGMSPSKDGEQGGVSNHLYVAWKFYASSPANVTVSMQDEGFSNGLMSGYFELA